MWLAQIAGLNLLWHPSDSNQVWIANLATERTLWNGPIEDEHVDLVFACKQTNSLMAQNANKKFTCLDWLPFGLECAFIQRNQPGMLLLAAGCYKQGREGILGCELVGEKCRKC
jgi:hypothetical protein